MKSYYAHYVFFLDETKPATAVLLSTCAPGDLRSYELDHNHHINLEYKVYYFGSMQQWLEQFITIHEPFGAKTKSDNTIFRQIKAS